MTEKFLHSDTITRLQEWAVDPHTQQPVRPVPSDFLMFYSSLIFHEFNLFCICPENISIFMFNLMCAISRPHWPHLRVFVRCLFITTITDFIIPYTLSIYVPVFPIFISQIYFQSSFSTFLPPTLLYFLCYLTASLFYSTPLSYYPLYNSPLFFLLYSSHPAAPLISIFDQWSHVLAEPLVQLGPKGLVITVERHISVKPIITA